MMQSVYIWKRSLQLPGGEEIGGSRIPIAIVLVGTNGSLV